MVVLLLSSAVWAQENQQESNEEVSGLLTNDPTIADQQYYLSPPSEDKKSEYAHYFNQPDPPQVSVEQVAPGSFLSQRHHPDNIDHPPSEESIQETSSGIQQSTESPAKVPTIKTFDLESILALKDLRKSTQNRERSASDSIKRIDDYLDISPPLIDQEPNYYVTKHNEERKKFKKTQEKKAEKENHDGVNKPKVIRKSSKYRKIENHNKPLESAPTGGQRVEYQMHGHLGPKSYKFGYDTGNDGGLENSTASHLSFD